MRPIAALACGGLLVVLASACGPGMPTTSDKASSPGPGNRTAVPTGANPSGVDAPRTPGAVPPPLPAGMPIYPRAAPLDPDTNGSAISAWSTMADPPDVYAFYVAELSRAGFEVSGAMPGGDAAVIRFSTPDGVTYQLDLTGHAPVRITLGWPHD